MSDSAFFFVSACGLFLIYAIVFISLGRYIAREKGRSPREGGAWGFFFGVFGLIIIALLPTLHTRRPERDPEYPEGDDGLADQFRDCPECLSCIPSVAKRCRFCGAEVPVDVIAEAEA